jgi:hypothetical protein
MAFFQGIAEVVKAAGPLAGPLVGIIAGLMWLLWKKDQEHREAMKDMVPPKVYDDLCKQRDRQADLLGSLSASVAILVDRGAAR